MIFLYPSQIWVSGQCQCLQLGVVFLSFMEQCEDSVVSSSLKVLENSAGNPSDSKLFLIELSLLFWSLKKRHTNIYGLLTRFIVPGIKYFCNVSLIYRQKRCWQCRCCTWGTSHQSGQYCNMRGLAMSETSDAFPPQAGQHILALYSCSRKPFTRFLVF